MRPHTPPATAFRMQTVLRPSQFMQRIWRSRAALGRMGRFASLLLANSGDGVCQPWRVREPLENARMELHSVCLDAVPATLRHAP